MATRGIKRYFQPIERSPAQKPVASDNSTSADNRSATPVPEIVLASSISNETPSTPSRSQANGLPTEFSTPANRIKRPRLETPTTTPRRTESQRDGSETNVEESHVHLTYSFLYPPKRRDINNKSPEDPEYDEKTLYIPESFLNSQSPAMRQWWLIKQKNMDSILFFKMGKFYELFNEDAVIAVNNLDIMYMKGDDTKPAHAGFPEVSYEKYARVLINLGYKVLRVEQTETPAMMEERCNRTGKRGKFDKVVKREVCRITTRGTQMMGVTETVFHSSQNQYLLALSQSAENSVDESGSKSKLFGVSFIDVTIGKLYIGQFQDDNNLSKLNISLAHHTPTEILYERGNLNSDALKALVKTGASLTPLRSKSEFWPIKKALSHLRSANIFQEEESDNFEWPSVLKSLFLEGESSESLMTLEPKEEYRYALNSFGALVYYLHSQLILDQVMKGANFEIFSTPLDSKSNSQVDSTSLPPMIMDHVALRNLEIFSDSTGNQNSTLYDSINHCKTHFGQRLLKNWICCPLRDCRVINERLDAVEVLVSNESASLMNEIVHVLGQTPDLERLLSKIKSQCFKSESESRAIMFDGDRHSKVKISSFLNLLNNFRRLQKFIKSVSDTVKKSNSKALRRLLTLTTDDGLYPDYSATLDFFDSAFDHETARQTGKIIPSSGMDREYDICQERVSSLKDKLDEYLEEQKKVLGCRQIEYYGTAKNRYQIQVPEIYCKNIPPEYRIETTRKGFKRYYTTTIDKLFAKLTTHEEEVKRCLDNIMSKVFEQFSRKMKLWTAAIGCVAVVDVLQSIASFVRSLKANGVDVCRPTFLQTYDKPFIDYKDGRHPALIKTDPNYIPNDLLLDDRMLLLSGANMGGKSTLMRQTALLVILAQIGCYVPASMMRLTPVDRIFSRLGASDRLLEGESTFYTELVETSAMLRCATSDSLLLLDELGRGTATYDGTAIAYSVIQEVSKNLKCRCLFSTHYHSLVRDFQGLDDKIRLAHMACKVECESEDVDPDPLKENIHFLYKIADGPAARSYGFNVAKLAGIEDSIIKDAVMKSRELELSSKILSALQEVCISDSTSPKDESLKRKVLTRVTSGQA